MRRKKNDKRVLISPRDNRNHPRSRNRRYNQRKPRKTNGITLILMILAIVAFVIGAGIGVSLSFDDGSQDESPHVQNVTKEMTTNLNDTEPIYYDELEDNIDFNDNETLSELNVTQGPSY